MKSILILGNYPPPFGGIPRHLESLCPFLNKKDWRVYVVSGGDGGVERDSNIAIHRPVALRALLSPFTYITVLPAMLSYPFGSLIPYHSKLWLRYLIYLAVANKILKEAQINLISAYNLQSFGAMAAILSSKYNVPFVVTNFGEIFSERRFFRNHSGIVEYICSGASKLLAMSRHCGDSYRLIGRNPDVQVIPYGVDTQKFNININRDIVRIEFEIAKDDQVVFFLARMNRDMGLHVLLQAIPTLLQDNGSIKVLIAGERGELTEDAYQVAEGRENRVFVVERVPFDRLEFFYATADVVVVPTIGDRACGSLTAIEAMSCGRPVIGSNVGGIPEIILDGETGLLVPPGDPESLGKGIAKLLRNSGAMSRMGASGRKRAEQLFSEQETNEKLERLFLEVCRQ